MAFPAQLPPNTILLSDNEQVIRVGDIPAGEAITPGHLIEMYRDAAGAKRWRKNSSATEQVPLVVALDQPELNKDIDTAYAAGDLVQAAFLQPGCVFYGLIASGQDILVADPLQSAGNGTLKEATATTADANVYKFQALDEPGAVTVTTRVRAQVIQ